MNRIEITQRLINKIGAKNYLEIGVEFGTAFFRIRAERKIAIDPEFKISWKRKLLDLPHRFKTKYFPISSDDFFAKHTDLFTQHKIDVALIDGLHTFEQSLKDAENCLRFLNKKGVIVMHDCNPQSPAAAAPKKELTDKLSEAKGKWNGEVWKTIVYLRSSRPDLNVLVLDCDYGLGLIKKGAPEKMLDYSRNQVQAMTYRDLARQREEILNFKKEDYFGKYLELLNNQ